MKIKKLCKKTIAESMYWCYRYGICRNHLRVLDIDKTIQRLIDTEDSFVRFGDGEIRLIEGDGLPLQKCDPCLSKRLAEILQMNQKRLMIGIPDIFTSLEKYRHESQMFWKEHLLFYRKKYERYCDEQLVYYDAFFSRLYYMYHDRELSRKRFEKIKNIWKDKDVVVIESKSAHTGVDNDLLEKAKTVRRILCPESNAFDYYDKLLKIALTMENGVMFLISAGPTAKLLVVDLLQKGYRALDIGSLDMEYQWYCMRAEEKCHPPKKNCMTEEQDLEAGYTAYLSQIIYRIKE